MRSRSPLTLLLALTAFKDKADADADKVTQITPDATTRFAFQTDQDGTFIQVEISSQTGPQSDNKLELVDAIYFASDEIDVTEVDRALVVRVENTELSPEAIQAIGETIESYMDQNGCGQFATAAIHDIGEGQDLHGKWQTYVFTRAYDGQWSAKSLGFTSVAKTDNGAYGVLLDGKLAQVKDSELISTLLDDQKLDAALNGGYQLPVKKAHLVRPPVGQAFAVVASGEQIVYDGDFQMVGEPQSGFTCMQAIDVDGSPKPGVVNTVSGKGNNWDVRTAIPASKAGKLAQAYGAQAA